MDFIEPCFGIGHNLSLICQMTSEDIKHQLIIIIKSFPSLISLMVSVTLSTMFTYLLTSKVFYGVSQAIRAWSRWNIALHALHTARNFAEFLLSRFCQLFFPLLFQHKTMCVTQRIRILHVNCLCSNTKSAADWAILLAWRSASDSICSDRKMLAEIQFHLIMENNVHIWQLTLKHTCRL